MIQIIDQRDETRRRGEAFVSTLKPSDEVYLLGTNKYGVALVDFLRNKGLEVKGFINDYTNDPSYAGKPVVQSTTNFSGAKLINAIVEGRTIDGERLIGSKRPLARCDYFALQRAFASDLTEVDFLEDTDTIWADRQGYDWLYHVLADETSKEHLSRLVQFRLNRDIQHLEGFQFKINEQYFEDFFDVSKTSTFVDGGGFDANTAWEYVQRQPMYERVYIFEPNVSAFNAIIDRVKQHPKIECFNRGLWSHATTLRFNGTLGSASRIEQFGRYQIETVALDEVVDGRVDFIKLDIEGAEKEALAGARETIASNLPVLAVCVYHRQRDFLDIPRHILGLVPDYRVYLRHYTQGVFETVMFFVPKKFSSDAIPR